MRLAKAAMVGLLNSDNAHRVASVLIQSNVTLDIPLVFNKCNG